MAKTNKPFQSILDLIAKQLAEEGHHSYHRASMLDDKLDFGMPRIKKLYDETENHQARIDRANKTPVSGKPDPDLEPEQEFSKQLRLKPSSTIQSAAYWPTKEYLVVSFKSGATYSYSDVPMTTVQLWQVSSSAGSFFYYNIRMSYPYQKIG